MRHHKQGESFLQQLFHCETGCLKDPLFRQEGHIFPGRQVGLQKLCLAARDQTLWPRGIRRAESAHFAVRAEQLPAQGLRELREPHQKTCPKPKCVCEPPSRRL